MMDYEIFKEAVKENFLSYMPKSYQDMEVRVDLVDKVNRKLDGLSLLAKNEKTMISPTLYINDMYGEYLKTEDLQTTLEGAAKTMDEAFRKSIIPPMDISTAKDNIIFQFVNTEQNKDMLKNVPHKEFQDLSIIFRWVVNMDRKGITSSVINNKLAEKLGMDAEQLLKAATINTRRILPPVVLSMNEVVKNMFADKGMLSEVADHMIGERDPKMSMWVISNERMIEGAASMLYKDILHKLAESMGTDLYILPSSIHEVIAVSVEMGEPEKLAQVVAEVNMEQVNLSERLSNQVYHYDKELMKITLASDTPNKRLDGMALEQPVNYQPRQSR